MTTNPGGDIPVTPPSPRSTTSTIACTLRPDALRTRVDEWQQALDHAVTGVERQSPQRLRVHLQSDPAAMAALVLLAGKEKECCPFFGFTFEVEVGSFTLVIEVPTEAEALLDSFAGLAGHRLL
jgi:hypothetical protein